MAQKNFQTIISVNDLKKLVDNQAVVVIDARYSLTDSEYGATSYAQGHIPGAQFVDMDVELSTAKRVDTGRHPLPEKSAFVAAIQRLGIRNDDQVVVYDDVSGAVCGRFWWMLRWAGHHNVAVLDGGIKTWIADNLPLSTTTSNAQISDFSATFDDTLLITTEEVVAGLKDNTVGVIDARAQARYRGEVEPIDPIAGHIPGAVNWPLTNNLDEHGCFLSPETLREKLSVLDAVSSPSVTQDTIAHSCGSGVSACHNLLAWEIAGFDAGKLYVGSWSEWITDSSRGVAVSDV